MLNINNNSPFHEEDLKRVRKDHIKKEIHELNKDPLNSIETFGKPIYKYEIILKNLNNLVLEMDLNLDDENECEKLKDELSDFLIFNSIHETGQKVINNSIKTKSIFHKDRWVKFEKILYKYQKLIFKLDRKYNGDTKSEINRKEV